jgi:hypothetical protein
VTAPTSPETNGKARGGWHTVGLLSTDLRLKAGRKRAAESSLCPSCPGQKYH